MARSGNRPGERNKEGKRTASRLTTTQSRRSNRLQDTVYREMLLLESKRPGAEMGLALALLRAMAESEQMADRDEMHEWLKNVCPHCLKMIDSALDGYSVCDTRPH